MTVLRQSAGRRRPEREEGVHALDRWVREDLARRHEDAFTDVLPRGWLSLIAAAERPGSEGQTEG